VQADTVRLTQVISNLLNNAARYTDAGGELSVSYGCEGNDAWVVVTDNGRGIPEELVGHIFDVFVQETRGGGGLGLGLTLVQRITEMHGGHVSVTSEGVGKGSRFEVRLPADGVKTVDRPAAPPLHALREPEPAPVPPRGPAARVLDVVLIEDNDDIRETLVLLLERWGHRVRVAASGERGVELVLEMPPAVALVDIGLPALDGYGVARQICASLCERRPRLVAMTGYGQPEARAHAIDSGFDAHLVKPASPADLRRALVPE
jgi:CheY-like chemotaxis protein